MRCANRNRALVLAGVMALMSTASVAPARAMAAEADDLRPEPEITVIPIGPPGSLGADLSERGHVAYHARDIGPEEEGGAFRWYRGDAVRVAPAAGPGAFADAVAVNDRGQVVGYTSDYEGIGPNGFVWTDGVYTPVPTPSGISYAVDVNNSGHVLLNRDPDSYPSDILYLQAGVLIGDQEVTSPVFPGQRPIVGVAINDRGTVIGNAEAENDQFRLTGYAWRPGREPVSLSTYGGYSRAFEINDRGTILGWGTTADGRSSTVLWRHGRMIEVGLHIHDTPFWGDDRLNNRNQVVGQMQTPTGETHAALWSRGRLVDLGTLGGPSSLALGVNDRAEVVGLSERSDGTYSAFLWRDGTMIDLGALTGQPNVVAFEINDRGQVLGLRNDPSGGVVPQSYLWETRPKR